MASSFVQRSWSPYIVGALIGVLSWFAFATADKPIGITTAFEHTAALSGKAAVPELEQKNAYFAAKTGRRQFTQNWLGMDACCRRLRRSAP
jgi:hypothetical protein